MREDLASNAYSIWNIAHQWPSVGICAQHAQILLVLRNELQLPEVRNWYLPHDLSESDWLPAPSPNAALTDALLDTARWTNALLAKPDHCLDGSLLRTACLLQAKKRGWIAMDGSVRLQELRDAFEVEHKAISRLPGLTFLANVAGPNGGFLGLLLRQYPGLRHPAKQLCLMRFLFREPEAFFLTYDMVSAADKADKLSSVITQLTEVREQLKTLVGEQGRSVNSACKTLGVPPSQAIRFLKAEGIAIEQRPRVLDPVKQDKLMDLLRIGAEREEIASTLGIKKTFLRAYLAQNLELRTVWDNARWSRRSTEYRAHFSRVLDENPGVPIKRIRRIAGNGFEWLYRNDRDWLASHLPSIWRR